MTDERSVFKELENAESRITVLINFLWDCHLSGIAPIPFSAYQKCVEARSKIQDAITLVKGG